jgi:hypothetical protein
VSAAAATLDVEDIIRGWIVAEKSLGSHDRRIFKSMLSAAIDDDDLIEARRVVRSALEAGGFRDEILVRRETGYVGQQSSYIVPQEVRPNDLKTWRVCSERTTISSTSSWSIGVSDIL